MTSRTTRLARAGAIRDALLPWLREHGAPINVGALRVIEARIGEFYVLYRTPFSGRFPEPVRGSHQAAVLMQQRGGKINLDYGLDVWCGRERRKVMNLEWSALNDCHHLAGFRAGEWDRELATLITDYAGAATAGSAEP